MNVSFDRMKRSRKLKTIYIKQDSVSYSGKKKKTSPLKVCIKRRQNILATGQDIIHEN